MRMRSDSLNHSRAFR